MKKLLLSLLLVPCFCFADPFIRDYENETWDQHFKKMMLYHLDHLDEMIKKQGEGLSSQDQMLMVFDVHKSREIFNYFIMRYVEPFDPLNELSKQPSDH